MNANDFGRFAESMRGKTQYERLFGTPERVADFAIENCRWDCYVCPFDGNLCDNGRSPNSKDRGAMLEWLRGDAE